jgi:hypothetical protein
VRRSKDCPECRLTAHKGRCAFCAGSGSVPLCPPIGEVVIYREFLGGGLVPMMVHSSERKAGKGGQAVVEISGYIPSQGRLQPEVLGPSVDRGCWDWKGERS